jgi:hypothetical protein
MKDLQEAGGALAATSLGLAGAAANAGAQAQEPGGAPATANIAPIPTEGTAGAELIGAAERATATEPEALVPWAGDEAGRALEMAPHDNTPVGERVLEAPPPHKDTAKRGRRPHTPHRRHKRSMLPQEGECVCQALPNGCPTGRHTAPREGTPWPGWPPHTDGE